MRFDAEAPRDVMEQLFVELMLWGKAQGYATFDLGVAPMSGLEARRLAPLWSRIGALAFRYGEHFYNFQGLRRFKEKFEPQGTGLSRRSQRRDPATGHARCRDPDQRWPEWASVEIAARNQG